MQKVAVHPPPVAVRVRRRAVVVLLRPARRKKPVYKPHRRLFRRRARAQQLLREHVPPPPVPPFARQNLRNCPPQLVNVVYPAQPPQVCRTERATPVALHGLQLARPDPALQPPFQRVPLPKRVDAACNRLVRLQPLLLPRRPVKPPPFQLRLQPWLRPSKRRPLPLLPFPVLPRNYPTPADFWAKA